MLSNNHIFFPTINTSDITSPLIDENYYVIFPLAQGLNIDNSDAASLLDSSSSSFSKKDGYYLTTYDKEDEDSDGPFSLAITLDTNNDGELIWFASSYFLEDVYNSYSSGANLNLAINALSELIGQEDNISISSKSLNYSYLTISDSSASLLKKWMIGIIPFSFVVYGILTVIDRRKKHA